MTGPASDPRWKAVGRDLALLARLHDREPDAALIGALRAVSPSDWFALDINGEEFDIARALLNEAFSQAPDPITPAALDDIAAEYAAIYLNHAYRISPCESYWVGEEGLERQEAMFVVRRIYAGRGFRAPNWRTRPDDHIALELSFLSALSPALESRDAAAIVGEFLRRHPLVWVPDFAGRMVRRCRSPFYAGVAMLTVAYLKTMAAMLSACLGLDMTLVSASKLAAAPQGPTCGDPPPRYAPGAGPGW